MKDTTIVITGGIRGIGRSIAEVFSKAGGSVVAIDINEDLGVAVEQELRQIGYDFTFVRGDLSVRGEASEVIRKIFQDSGKIDVLVNNARTQDKAGLDEETEEDWDMTMAVMLRAPFFASREVIHCMKETDTHGSIINIASILSRFVIKQAPAYHVAKAGVVQLTRYLAMQAAPHGIRVNSISPGFILQEEHRTLFEGPGNIKYRATAIGSIPLGRVGTADEIAKTAFYLASPESSFITGQDIIVDGGSTIREHLDLLQERELR
ncbi:MAG: hypothetical protein COZ46_00200 [Verrucomicrobia bacterium CG_4_10_14_3_um_filter_43_23]|nr:MAG: hypothetical protein AUJ82_04740 [Verrucomicrobia bacterium CG1_02_43_26]PIP58999.1 MAG: hypothetical protein COX01_05465 [Verrucomicrobia bacterium CG22_combo_CG10-13_8_21_14_all_43_17]PIX59097.1 MAG: hypothetical protein COZ46_00200 [Verrucomicrobia bacterium CG_4_10_14_3_um_filter_43_23]PIY61381.1 MAG: hypothetical protein COY94_05910 [Verrucomicrobia bacterium CG_4_10_14_0_8_um_filter_43_34]PJA44163.1 MAG: hypothetical protein CO175_04625 [Verrucomicrobia bacterium CG_4_9_14_3_um_fi